jgi:hypothetical protein
MVPAFHDAGALTKTLRANAVLWEEALAALIDDAADLAQVQRDFLGRYGDDEFGSYATQVTGSPLAKAMLDLDRRHINLSQLQKTAEMCGQETGVALDAVIKAYAQLSGKSQAVVNHYYALQGVDPNMNICS